jgi:uncharacterized protein DUF5719
MKQSELIFVGVLLAIVAVGVVLIDLLIPQAGRSPNGNASGPVLSSGWYCPSPPSSQEFQASMSTANPGRRALGLRSFAVGGSGQSAFVQSNLEPGHQSTKLLGEFNVNDAVGVVDAFRGQSATDLVVLGKGKGVGSSRCSAQPSNRWLFATASTARGENHYLLVANPFKEEAVISVRFIAPDKDVVPARLKDLVVPAQSQTTVSLADYFVESPAFGLDVTAAQGRVVVSRYSQLDRGGAKGASLDVGVSGPSASWTFAEGEPQGEESIVVINPGSREALIGVVFMTEGERTAPPALAEVPVPAGRQITINTAEHIPAGTSHGISLISTNGEPVVAERRTTAGIDKNNGYETSFGAPTIVRRWTVPVGSPAGGNSKLSIVNPGNSRTLVKVTLLGGAGLVRPDQLASLPVEAGRKVTIDLNPLLNGGFYTAVVESNRHPIAVESTVRLPSPYSDVSYNPGQPLT